MIQGKKMKTKTKKVFISIFHLGNQKFRAQLFEGRLALTRG